MAVVLIFWKFSEISIFFFSFIFSFLFCIFFWWNVVWYIWICPDMKRIVVDFWKIIEMFTMWSNIRGWMLLVDDSSFSSILGLSFLSLLRFLDANFPLLARGLLTPRCHLANFKFFQQFLDLANDHCSPGAACPAILLCHWMPRYSLVFCLHHRRIYLVLGD